MAQLVDASLLVTSTQWDHQLNVPEHRAQGVGWHSPGGGVEEQVAATLLHRSQAVLHSRAQGWVLGSHAALDGRRS